MKPINSRLLKKLKSKRAVIWDFDGVICFMDWFSGGSLSTWKDKLWQLLETYEPNIRQKFSQGLKQYYEHTDYIARTYGQKAIDEMNRFYLKKELSIIDISPLNLEIIDIIGSLENQLEHFIWSNNQEETIVRTLERAGITNKFKTVVSRTNVTLAKPNLEGFTLIKTTTRTPVSDFIVVGDSLVTDAVVAKRLGIDFFHYQPD